MSAKKVNLPKLIPTSGTEKLDKLERRLHWHTHPRKVIPSQIGSALMQHEFRGGDRWPKMRAETAAEYCDEPSVEAFKSKVKRALFRADPRHVTQHCPPPFPQRRQRVRDTTKGPSYSL